MKIGKEGLELIKDYEKLKLKAYRDAAGYWTIGWGHLIKKGEEHLKKGAIPKKKADELLRQDLATAELAVNQQVHVPLKQNQFDALVSFVYNVGAGNFRKSGLRRQLNNKQYVSAGQEFAKWVRAGGKKYRGLLRRRADEMRLYASK